MKNKTVLILILLFTKCIGVGEITPIHKNTTIIEAKTSSMELVDIVQEYINYSCGIDNYVSAVEFLRCSYKYDIDLYLMLTQARLESHFGTRGRALRTNSIFGVGAWDSGVEKCTFDNPNESIEAYSIHIKENYLYDDLSVHELIRKGFKSKNGFKYASDVNYPNKVKREMNRVKKITSIQETKEKLEAYCEVNNINITNLFE